MIAAQTSKRPGAPCGDVIAHERTPAHLTVICADGIGSGIRANVAASMCTSRLLELLRGGFSLRRAFESAVRTMEASKGHDLPYVAFSLARILSDGQATVLCYDVPGAMLVGRRNVGVLPARPIVVDSAVTLEANCHLEAGEGLMLCSDGITQAGLGGQVRGGWGLEGAARYATDMLTARTPVDEVPEALCRQAGVYSVGTPGDDCSVALARCRPGVTVTILTGPPSDRSRDHETARRFMNLEGPHVICGASTADVVARYLGREVQMDRGNRSLLAPPSYVLEGVELVTEGAVTLNQLYNVLDESGERFEEDSGVTQLHSLLQAADRVVVLLGGAQNPANTHISFRQRGILPRQRIVGLLAEKLRDMGKLVVVEKV